MLDTAGTVTRSGVRPWTRLIDAHVHIIDPAYPLRPDQGYLPEPFTISSYRARTCGLGVEGGAVVAGSFQGLEQDFMVDALAELGPAFAGVIQLAPDTSDRRVLELDAAGVRGIRLNPYRGGSAALEDLEGLARRVHDLAGWHAEVYIDARTIDESLSRRIAALPAASIDHLGMHEDGLSNLLRLVEQGVKVKATGFGRVELDPAATVRAIDATDPTALMVGTDLPSTRARRPFRDEDLALIVDALPADRVADVFWNNAASFYLGA